MAVQRLFFALWPDQDFCQRLLEHAKPGLRESNGRAVARDNLHITLAFLGNVDETEQQCLQHMAEAIQLPAFDLNLDRLAYWPRPRVVWAGTNDTPEVFIQLAKSLQRGVAACGLQIDTRPPVAHLTLKRKVTKAGRGLAFAPLAWHVERFYLVASRTLPEGPVYTRLQSWSLRG